MAGRLVNVTGEVLQVTHNEDLRAVFFNSPGEELALLVIVLFFLSLAMGTALRPCSATRCLFSLFHDKIRWLISEF